LDKINSAAARYPVSHLIKEIRADSSYRGGPIRLVACHGSAPWSEIAATLADALGVPVLGATTAVIPTPGRRLGDPWTHVLEDPDGTVGIWLEHQPRTRPEGWRIITDGLGALSPATLPALRTVNRWMAPNTVQSVRPDGRTVIQTVVGPSSLWANCERAAVTVDAILAGNPASALPAGAFPTSFFDRAEQGENTLSQDVFGGASIDMMPGPDSVAEYLRDYRRPGDGGLILIRRNDNSGHAYNVVRLDGGEVLFIDATVQRMWLSSRPEVYDFRGQVVGMHDPADWRATIKHYWYLQSRPRPVQSRGTGGRSPGRPQANLGVAPAHEPPSAGEPTPGPPASLQDRAAASLQDAGHGSVVEGMRASVNPLDECGACINASFTMAMGMRFPHSDRVTFPFGAPASALSASAWPGMTRWTDLWRLLGRLPLVFSSGRGPDPLAAAKDAVREAAKSGRPASGILNIRYEKPDGASQALPWHTVVISSHDGVSVTLEDPDKGVELTDEAIRTGAAHSHVVAAQRGGPVQETGPQRFSIDLLFTHDEPGAPLAGLPDTVVQGWATTTGDTTTVLLDVRERPTLDALGVPYLFADAQGRTYDPGSDPDPDPPAFVAVTHRLPSAPPLGRDGRVWIEYDKANPSTPVRIVPQRTDDRVDLTWAQATAPPSEAPSGSGAVASSGTPADVPDTGDSFGVPEHLLRSRLAKVRSALIVDPQVFVDPLSRALAVDRLRAGGSTDAVPGSIVDLPELERLLRRPGEHFDDIGDLAAHVAALGHGARGIAEIEYRELGRRHAVVVENVLGRVVFLQDGAVLTPGPDRLSDRRGPRALTTGLVVAPELLDGPTEASALPELSDVSYRFVRSDDAIVAGTSPGGVVTVDDRSGREAAVLEFLEGVGPWLGDMAVPEDELLEVLGSDAVVLVAGPSGAVRGLARAVLVVGEDGSTTGRVGSMLVDPRYRDGGVVERELSRGMERRLAGLGADRIEWPVVRPRGSEPATSVFHEPRFAGLVGSSASSASAEVGAGGSSGKSLGMTVGDAAGAAFGRMGDLGDAVFGQTFANRDAGVL
ncbi:MAG: toxin glutamine deamidase domain-containing protein, partial [Phycicoccus sp.]